MTVQSGAHARGMVVVGGGVAAAKAVETLRSEGHTGPVTVLSAEPLLPYDRPPLSKQVLKGDDEPDSTTLLDQAWYVQHDVDVRLGVPASGLDTDAHLVRTADGDELGYERLLLATGSKVRTLPVPGADLPGVLTLRSLADSVRLRDAFAERPRVVVVGAGWIGLEVAAAARQHGAEVTVVSPQAPLVGVLGSRLSDVFAAAHRDAGVDLRIGPGVAEIRGTDTVQALVTDDGAVLPADLVVVGVGVSPHLELAGGLALDDATGGVRVDAGLRTSAPDVFAAGDIASWPCTPLGGRRMRVEHWANAHDGGVAAARAMLGQDVAFDVLPFFWSDQYELGMEYVGHVASLDAAQVVTRGDVEGAEFMAFWVVDGQVDAGMHVNVWDTVDDIQALVRSRRVVDTGRLADPDIALADV
ncbi:FAD-dependent oxidoreductase [soil metagenome]